MKKKLYHLLSPSTDHKGISYWIDLFLITLIALNVLVVLLESVEEIDRRFEHLFNLFEVFSIGIFTLEYLLRVWVITEDEQHQHPIQGRLKFMISPLAIIDLLSFLPFYFPFFGFDLRFIRIMRVMRIFRLFKIVRYVNALALITDVLRQKREELYISLILTLFLLLLSSSMMYFVENPAQPGNFSSIPETMWWGISTLTTVGYGDMYPITPLGKILGGIISIIGIGLFALPTGILASGFSEAIKNRKQKKQTHCPACGRAHEPNTEHHA